MQGQDPWCWWSRLRRFEAIRLHRTGYRLYGASASKRSLGVGPIPLIRSTATVDTDRGRQRFIGEGSFLVRTVELRTGPLFRSSKVSAG